MDIVVSFINPLAGNLSLYNESTPTLLCIKQDKVSIIRSMLKYDKQREIILLNSETILPYLLVNSRFDMFEMLMMNSLLSIHLMIVIKKIFSICEANHIMTFMNILRNLYPEDMSYIETNRLYYTMLIKYRCSKEAMTEGLRYFKSVSVTMKPVDIKNLREMSGKDKYSRYIVAFGGLCHRLGISMKVPDII